MKRKRNQAKSEISGSPSLMSEGALKCKLHCGVCPALSRELGFLIGFQSATGKWAILGGGNIPSQVFGFPAHTGDLASVTQEQSSERILWKVGLNQRNLSWITGMTSFSGVESWISQIYRNVSVSDVKLEFNLFL